MPRAAAAESFLGFDHLDVRVRSLELVEAFYDRLLPLLGLPNKNVAYVDAAGHWSQPSDAHPYNAIEYYERPAAGRSARFIGFIEVEAMIPVATRIAFAVASPEAVREFEREVRSCGARAIEFDDDFEQYPALFFEDPAGTRLEICARPARPEAERVDC